MSTSSALLSPIGQRAADALIPPRDRLAELEVDPAAQIRTERAALAAIEGWKPFAFVGCAALTLLVLGSMYSDARRRRAS